MSNYKASGMMRTIMSKSARDKDLSPSADQIFELFNVLEPKLKRCGFMDGVLGWKALLLNSPNLSPEARRFFRTTCDQYPDSDCIYKILEAFSTVGRIGEADVKYVVITCRSCTPWLAAFTVWSLGVNPAIHTMIGDVVYQSDDSPVVIKFSEDTEYGDTVAVEIVGSNDTFLEVFKIKHFSETESFVAKGMVKIRGYTEIMLQRQLLADDLDQEALHHAIPFALKQVRDLCTYDEGSLDCHGIDFLGNPFPVEAIVAKTATKYLGAFKEGYSLVSLKALGPTALLKNLEIVKYWENRHKKSFAKYISPIVADILALSLFEPCEGLPLL